LLISGIKRSRIVEAFAIHPALFKLVIEADWNMRFPGMNLPS
jgi:hypothetical protein